MIRGGYQSTFWNNLERVCAIDPRGGAECQLARTANALIYPVFSRINYGFCGISPLKRRCGDQCTSGCSSASETAAQPQRGLGLISIVGVSHSRLVEDYPETSKHLSEVASAQGHKPELDESRKPPLGSAHGRNGVAEYRFLVRSGKFIDIKPTGDKTIPEAQNLIVGAEYTGLFSAGSQVTLVYLGFINCHSSVCEHILEPLK